MCQGQEKTKELLKTESQWDMRTECNMGYWIEFYNRKKDCSGKLMKSK